ncbi:MAG: DUF3806 domain-containing protein [Motiliproteus sp.]
MQQMISVPSQEDIEQLSKQLKFIEMRIGLIVQDAAFDGSLNDLDLLQQALDSGQISAEDTVDLQSLGVPFGQLFINNNPGFDWWMVDDEIGRAACLRYRETDLLLYPLTLISKRIEEGEAVNIRQLFMNLGLQLQDVTRELDMQPE